MKKILLYVLYLLVVWGGFRYFFNFPGAIEELWIKPVIWLIPLFWWNIYLKKERVLFFEGGAVKSLLMGGFVGMFYWLIVRQSASLPSMNLDLLGVALATSIVEELAFSGFVLGYLQKKGAFSKNMLVFVLGGLVALSRLPILLFDYKLPFAQIMYVCLFVFAASMINGLIRLKSGNVIGSIVARFALNIATLV